MAWDSDGDSLSYELIAPEVESYQFPDEVVPFSFLEIDTMSGQVNWFNPAEGIYHLGLQIREYRQGLQLSAQTVIMQVEILSVVNSTTVQKPLAINIYPNPATDFLIIETEKKWGNDLQIRLFNTLGQLVQHKIWKGAHKLTLPVHNLPDGVYWLSIFKENKQQFEKVLICRE
mgnify:FL=1